MLTRVFSLDQNEVVMVGACDNVYSSLGISGEILARASFHTSLSATRTGSRDKMTENTEPERKPNLCTLSFKND